MVPARRSDRLAIAALLIAAAAVRVPFLFGYGIDDDEFYTVQYSEELLDTPTPPAVRTYPLTFAVTRALVELFGLSPFTLRVFPVVCGIASVLLVVRVGTRLLDRRAALFAGLLLAAWPWHQYFSGLARYYAPLFLFCLIAADRLEAWLRTRDPRAAAGTLGALLLAALTHPTGLLAVGGGAAAFAGLQGRRVRHGQLLALALAAFAVVVAAVLFTPLGDPVLHALSGKGGHGYSVASLLAGVAFNVTPMLAVLAVAGAAAWWSASRGRAAVYLVASAAVPVVLVMAMARAGLAVHPRYVMAGMPALVLLAGAGAAALIPAAGSLRLRAALGASLVLPLAPSVASNLIDGNRHPVPRTAEELAERLRAGELLFAEGHSLLGSYLFGLDRRLPAGEGSPPFPRLFEEVPPSPEHLQVIEFQGSTARFVFPENLFEHPPGPDYRALVDWLHDHAGVELRIGRRRLDYHRNTTVVFLARDGGTT